jgi:hypothetical protein
MQHHKAVRTRPCHCFLSHRSDANDAFVASTLQLFGQIFPQFRPNHIRHQGFFAPLIFAHSRLGGLLLLVVAIAIVIVVIVMGLLGMGLAGALLLV